jgi:hypothetical protein
MKPKPDCRTCGVCCIGFGEQEFYCDVTETDLKRLSPRFIRKNVVDPCEQIEFFASVTIAGVLQPTESGIAGTPAIRTEWKEMKTGPFAGSELNVCAALRGSVFSRVSCTIYPNRPKTCRKAVKPGDRTCRHARRLFEDAVRQIERKEAR